MKPTRFEYHSPATLAEALEMLAELGDDAKALAGGQTLVPLLALRLTRFDHLIDLNNVGELAGVEEDEDAVVVSAMTRQAVIGRHPTVGRSVPLLAEATHHIGHFQIRNRGTIGGSLAHGDAASEYPAAALALGASMEVASTEGRRSIPADQFFLGTWTTALEPTELLVAVRFPSWDRGSGFGLVETARRVGDFAITGAACGLQVGPDGRVARAGVALMGMAERPIRADAAEHALVGLPVTDLMEDGFAEIATLAVASSDPTDDVHASARYRRKVGAVMVQQALSKALASAAAGPDAPEAGAL